MILTKAVVCTYLNTFVQRDSHPDKTRKHDDRNLVVFQPIKSVWFIPHDSEKPSVLIMWPSRVVQTIELQLHLPFREMSARCPSGELGRGRPRHVHRPQMWGSAALWVPALWISAPEVRPGLELGCSRSVVDLGMHGLLVVAHSKIQQQQPLYLLVTSSQADGRPALGRL
jgi:hypothetical protein